jgi:hypothetical protein
VGSDAWRQAGLHAPPDEVGGAARAGRDDHADRPRRTRLRERGHTDVTVECAGRDAPLPLVPVVHEAIYRARFSEEIPAKSARVCEPVCAAANSPAPLAPEWNQTEWAF